MTTNPSPELLASLFHAAPCGLIWLDAQGEIQQINARAAQPLGGETARLLSTPLTAAVPAAVADCGRWACRLSA